MKRCFSFVVSWTTLFKKKKQSKKCYVTNTNYRIAQYRGIFCVVFYFFFFSKKSGKKIKSWKVDMGTKIRMFFFSSADLRSKIEFVGFFIFAGKVSDSHFIFRTYLFVIYYTVCAQIYRDFFHKYTCLIWLLSLHGIEESEKRNKNLIYFSKWMKKRNIQMKLYDLRNYGCDSLLCLRVPFLKVSF